jgi:acyl-CoA thioester hydrolase
VSPGAWAAPGAGASAAGRSAPSFSIRCSVYWEDTDAGGVVYYANYLKFLERCRTDWLRALGIDQRSLRAERGVQFAVVDLQVSYHKPALLHDEIIVTARLERLTGATMLFQQSIVRAEVTLIDAHVRVACLDASTLRPRGIPKDLFMEWRDAE